LYQGVFTPKRPNKFNINRLSEINRDLNEKEGNSIPNPFYEAIPEITNFINSNRRISLEGDNLNLTDFVSEPEAPSLNIQTPPVVTAPINPNIINQVSAQAGSTLPPNFASLSTAEKLKALQDIGITIR